MFGSLIDLEARRNEIVSLQTLTRVKATGWRGNDPAQNESAAKLLAALDSIGAVVLKENRNVLSAAELDAIQKASDCKVNVWALRAGEAGKLALHAKKGALAPGPPANIVVCSSDGNPVSGSGGTSFGYLALAVPKSKADELCARDAALQATARQRMKELSAQRATSASAEHKASAGAALPSDGVSTVDESANSNSAAASATEPVPTEEKEKEVKVQSQRQQRTTIHVDGDSSESEGDEVAIQLIAGRLLHACRL